MLDIELTHEDLAWLVNHIPPMMTWPHPQNHEDRNMLLVGDREEGGGAALRLKLFAARQAIMQQPTLTTLTVGITPAEAWLLDTSIWQCDYRKHVMDAGTPVVRLAEKVWNLLTEYHAGMLPENLRPQGVYKPVPIQDYQRTRLAEFDKMLGEDE